MVLMDASTSSEMYCIERLESGGEWVRELCFKTEFKAFVHARTKSRIMPCTYRVIQPTWNDVLVVLEGKSATSDDSN